jgi:bacteriocin biosynthesis cyclodehydratase domain-containing protein
MGLNASREIFPRTAERLIFLNCSEDITGAFLAAQSEWFHEQGPRGENQLQVVCTASLKDSRLRAFCKHSGPVLLIGVAGTQVTLGPLQILGRSVCLACVQYWAATAGWNQADAAPGNQAGPEVVGLAVRLTAEAVSEFHRTGSVATLETSLTAVDVESEAATCHPIFPRRNCPACVNLPQRSSMNPSVHCSALTGIVQHVKSFEQPILGVFQAGATLIGPVPARGTKRSLTYADSWGRGMSPQQARESCIGEALEFYSAAYRGNEKLLRGTLARTPGGIDPRTILLYSEKQYEDRSHSESVPQDRHAIPERFDPSRELDWLAGTDLIDGEIMRVPAACCLTGYQFGADEPKFAVADRSGLATGVTYADALAAALLELIEHDAVAIWWYNRVERPAIRPESFESPTLVTVGEALKEIGRRLWLLDLTTDLRIPAYAAISVMEDGKELLLGAAAHASPRIAAEKAVTEVPHLWLCMRVASMPPDFASWLSTAVLLNQLQFQPKNEIDSPPEPAPLTSSQIVALCIQRMKSAGIRPIAVNLTRPDVLVHAVRAVAPGMRSTRNRRGPGRLYEVPVRLGWLEEARTEAELNPTACVF